MTFFIFLFSVTWSVSLLHFYGCKWEHLEERKYESYWRTLVAVVWGQWGRKPYMKIRSKFHILGYFKLSTHSTAHAWQTEWCRSPGVRQWNVVSGSCHDAQTQRKSNANSISGTHEQCWDDTLRRGAGGDSQPFVWFCQIEWINWASLGAYLVDSLLGR